MQDPIRSLTRRRLLQFAGGGLGLNLGGLWQAQALGASAPPAIRSCILIFYYGGPSHLDTYDMKPDAPEEVRGEFRPISTSMPGTQICEHLPHMARIMHKVAVIRSMTHEARQHDSASIHSLTGRRLEGPDRELFSPEPQTYPCLGSAVAHQRRGQPLDVPFAALPFPFRNVVEVPCQGGGFLGKAYDPLLIAAQPAERQYRIPTLEEKDDLTSARLQDRRSLAQQLQHDPAPATDLAPLYDKAYRLLNADALRQAVDIRREPLSLRERFGFGEATTKEDEEPVQPNLRQMRGQNLLLARRLVEAGVPFVNVNDFRQQGQNWDSHVNNFEQHKSTLLPPADQALSALIEDLDERGLLATTLVVALGEFGRTPKVNKQAGRDHWPDCYSIVLAGGGVQGGAIIGASDRLGAYPTRQPITPGDLAATIFWRFGIDPAAEITDQTGRPHRLAIGEPIRSLFG